VFLTFIPIIIASPIGNRVIGHRRTHSDVSLVYYGYRYTNNNNNNNNNNMEDDVLFARRRRARAGYCGRDSGRTTAATTPYAHHEVSVKNRNELCSVRVTISISLLQQYIMISFVFRVFFSGHSYPLALVAPTLTDAAL